MRRFATNINTYTMIGQQGSLYFKTHQWSRAKSKDPLKWLRKFSDSELVDEYYMILDKKSKLRAKKRAIIVNYVFNRDNGSIQAS